jgi:hypothetical protein
MSPFGLVVGFSSSTTYLQTLMDEVKQGWRRKDLVQAFISVKMEPVGQ